jgi:membrane protease YdiL (CAAX protease family)
MTTQTPSEKNLLKRYPLVAFFVLAYLFFFLALMLIGGLLKMISVSPTGMSVLIALASWTPNLAAVVLVVVNSGWDKVRSLAAGWLKWRVPVQWYLFGLAPLAVAFGAAGLAVLMDEAPVTRGTGLTGATLFSMLLFNIIQGAMGEELGWRGYALPNLQKRYSPLTASIILGLVISGWHSILHLVSPTGVPEWQFWVIMVSFCILVTWAYNHSGGSLLIVSLFHFAFNFSIELVVTRLGLISLETLFVIYLVVYGLGALAVSVLGKMYKPLPLISQ